MTRRLPILTETTIASTKALKLSISQDYQLQLQTRTELSCRPGCNNCCKHPIFVSLLEGIITYRALVKQGGWAEAKPRLKESSQRTWGLSPEVWALSDLACPLLSDEGLCTIYEARPFSCRIAYSVGLPEDCAPSRFNGSFLPKAPMVEMFSSEERDLLDRHQTKLLRLPLASATLFGERIDQGSLTLEDSLGALIKEPSSG